VLALVRSISKLRGLPPKMPMKILVLCYEYPPLGGGGGRVARTVAEQLVARVIRCACKRLE
jgi:hypothetical protein